MDATLTQAAWHKIAFFSPALAQGASGRVGPQFCFDQREDGWRCCAGVLQKVFAQRRHWQSTFSGLQICLVQRQQWDLRVLFPSFTCGFNACPVPRVFCSSIFWQLLLWYDVKRLLSRASSEISWVASSLLTSLCRSWRKSRDDLLFFSSLHSTTCDSGGPGWTCVMETACESPPHARQPSLALPHRRHATHHRLNMDSSEGVHPLQFELQIPADIYSHSIVSMEIYIRREFKFAEGVRTRTVWRTKWRKRKRCDSARLICQNVLENAISLKTGHFFKGSKWWNCRLAKGEHRNPETWWN